VSNINKGGRYYVIRRTGIRTSIDIFDINGDGLPDRVMQNRPNNTWEVQLNSDYLPDLLSSVNNGIGGQINIEYAPSTQYNNTGSDGVADLPFPVAVVTSITGSDGRGNSYTTDYAYQDGAYSRQEREFRGFGYVKAADAEGNYVESYFKQDNVFKGKLYRQGTRDKYGNPFNIKVNDWRSKEVYPGVSFVYLQTTDSYTYDGDDTYRGSRAYFEYDDYGNPTKVLSHGDIDVAGDEKSVVTEYTYNADDWLMSFPKHTRLLDADQNKVSEKRFYYDDNADVDNPPTEGFLTKEEVWSYNPVTGGSSMLDTRYSYDDYGNLISAADSLGRVIATQYDDILHTYPVKTTNPLGHAVTSTYDYRLGKVLTATDPNGQTTENIYDALGRLVKVIGPKDSRDYPGVIYEYGLTALPIKITKKVKADYTASPGYLTTHQFYDGLGRLIQTRSPAEDDPETGRPRQVITGTVTFDCRGNIKEKYLPYFAESSPDFSPPGYSRPHFTFDYDPVGRLIRTTNPDSTFSSIAYDDRITTTTDENGHYKTVYYDAYGRATKIEEHNNADTYTTTYEYDTQGNLTRLTDNQSNTTQIRYDSLGRKIRMDDPDMGEWTYAYDKVGNLTEQTDAKGQIISFTYDSLNRLTRKRAGSQTIAAYYYDDASKENCIGRLSRIEDRSGQTEFFYDVLGRETKTIKTVNGAGSFTVERGYDALDRLTSLRYPDGEAVTYAYNKAGLIETVTGAGNYITNIDYSPTGQLLKVEYGNNTHTSYAYDPNTLRLVNLTTQSPQGRIQDLSYEFDGVGNVTSINDYVCSSSQDFSYDGLDRLTQAQGPYGTMTYSYDSIGNMTYKSDIGQMTYGDNAGPHALTSAQGTTYLYDANGNMTQGKNKQMQYDAENRLKKVITQASTTEFLYDGDGGRVIKTNLDTAEYTVYIGSIYEIDNRGDATKHIFAGSNRICSLKSGSTASYYHSDHLGSSNVVTDENGAKVALYEYKPYGSFSSSIEYQESSISHYFTGQELDSSTGLYYYGARYYDAELGRFTQPDSIVQAPYDPQTLNRYSYCRNNPVNLVDP
ncbi:MAG: hypothetical protein JRI96_17110, partial [Deltaproteobacteria bacterium]|nr:hypothetical protein [Deltaproteobacteria bacterium]